MCFTSRQKVRFWRYCWWLSYGRKVPGGCNCPWFAFCSSYSSYEWEHKPGNAGGINNEVVATGAFTGTHLTSLTKLLGLCSAFRSSNYTEGQEFPAWLVHLYAELNFLFICHRKFFATSSSFAAGTGPPDGINGQ